MKITWKYFWGAATVVLVLAGLPLAAQTQAGDTNLITCAGMVVDSAGQPVSGATMEFWSSSGGILSPLQTDSSEAKKLTMTTGTDGRFSNNIPPKIGFLIVQKNGFATSWQMLRQIGPIMVEPTDLKIVLTPPGVIAGTVMNESNQPVAKAEVQVALALVDRAQNNGVYSYNYLSGKLARERFSTATDASGHFQLTNFPTNAMAVLAAKAPGLVIKPDDESSGINIEEIGVRAGQADIKLVLEPAARVEGKVVFANNPQPLPMVQLTLQGDGRSGVRMNEDAVAKCDANGVFHFEHVPAGSYRVQASFGTNNSAGWVAEPTFVNVESGQIQRDVEVKITKGSLLEVTVLDSEHKPVPKMTVIAFREGSQNQDVTDAKGIAHFFALPGDYQLFAVGQSSASGQTRTTVEAGITNRVEIELGAVAGRNEGSASARKISGTVVSTNGQPAAGVSVQLVNASVGIDALKTDAQGQFHLAMQSNVSFNDGRSIPCILVRDVEHNLAVAQDLDDEVTNLNLVLAPALTLVGKVSADGKAVTNATAQLVFWSGNSGMWLRGLAISNTPGQYEIPALPPGRRYGVIVSAPGYGQSQNHNLSISSEAGLQELDPVELKPANLQIAGQVLDSDDKPVANCNVSIYGENQPNANVRTDREGHFVIKNVCEGTVRLSANARNSYGNITAEGGDTNVVLKLGQNMSYSSSSKQHKLRGLVTNTNGQPADGVQLTVFPNNNSRWVKTGTDGAYSLTWMVESWQMRNGNPQLVVRDKVHNLAVAEDISEETTNLNIRLQPALTVSGLVRNIDGTPLPSAQIGFWFKAGNSYDQFDQTLVNASADGRFELQCLPMSGQYIVWATAKGYGKKQQQLHPEYGTNHLELEAFVLRPANQVISGQVLKGDDKPASGVNVNINGEDQPDGSVTTDSQGRFRFQVCEGKIRLYAYSQNGNGSAQANVEAGDTNVVLTLSTSASSGISQTPLRPSLKGGTLPDLASVNISADIVPAGQPILLCLFDAAQRPSRHVVSQLGEQLAALKAKNIFVVGVQAAVIPDDTFSEWKAAKPPVFPIGRITENSTKTKWAAAAGALPWLVLTDASRKVMAEGFSLDELDAQVQKIAK